ncbi:MAG: rRNA maturation RNase YbeY [Clostridia bacterium]|nr:rRNA maturation RNase YbeY [Clostridia bacterium]
MIEINFAVQADMDIIRGCIKRAVEFTLCFLGKSGDVSVLVVDDDTIHRMNLIYRDVDRPTDVLSFPDSEGDQLIAPGSPYLGDIALSYDRAKAQADEYGHTFEREITFLVIHGLLHLMGYDHMVKADEEKMFKTQNNILEAMGILR